MRGSALIHLAFSMILVVGYQDFTETVKSEKILVGPSFFKIDGSKVQLKDLVANKAFKPGNDNITVLSITGGIKAQYLYIDEAMAVEASESCGGDIKAGWYTVSEWNAWDYENEPFPTCHDLDELENGECVMLMPLANNVGLVTSGEVASEDVDVFGPKKGEKSYRCNCSPVKINLGQIKPNAKFRPGQDNITLINKTGGIRGQYLYIDSAMAVEASESCGSEIKVGWYSVSEWNAWDYENEPYPTLHNDDVELKAGEGFMLMPQADGSGVIIPTAIPSEEK